MIDRNFYLDPRGTYQMQRQVQLRLADVYISLQAQYGEAANTADHQLYEQELAALEAEITTAGLAAEERECRLARKFAETVGIWLYPRDAQRVWCAASAVESACSES